MPHSSPSSWNPAVNAVRRPARSFAVEVLRVGTLPNRPDAHPAGVVHGIWIAYAVAEAGMAIDCSQGSLDLEPGQCYLVPPWQPVSYRLSHRVLHAYVAFDVGAFRQQLCHDYCCHVGICSPTAAQILQDLAGAIGQRTVADAGITLQGGAVAMLALADYLGQLPPEQAHALTAGSGRLAPALALIERELQRSLSVAEIAASLGLGERRCTELFHRLLGCSPMAYVTERRVRRAANALLETDASIDVIARRFGFPDRSYFSRVFARRMRQPPAAYRKQHGGDNS